MLASRPVTPNEVPDRLLAARALREEAEREGFTRFGVARAGRPPGFDRFEDWLDGGRHAGMRYLAETRDARGAPESLLPGARSVVCLAAPHGAQPDVSSDGSRFARYARGGDYHGSLRDRALRVAERARERLGGGWSYRVCVDSTPLAERSFAAAAGLGWIGKNGCLIDREQGSYLLLAEILTDLDLPADDPVAGAAAAPACAASRRVPTDAFVEPALLDAAPLHRLLDHRAPRPIPERAAKGAVGDHVFGCDVCQEVCPWNAPRRAVRARPGASPRLRRGAKCSTMGKGAWRRRFGKSAVNRAARRGLQRNAALSAGARADASCLPALRRAAALEEPGLSDAARWALRRLPALPL